jgi:hypothetical protein
MPKDEQANPGGSADRPLLVRKVKVARPHPSDAWPIEGGRQLDAAADDQVRPLRTASPGEPMTHREVYVLARGGDRRRLLVLPAGAGGQEKALAVFTDRDHAVFYQQSARLSDYEPVGLSPLDLRNWLREAPAEGVTLLAVDPNHLAQQRGEPQPALALEGLDADAAETLYREIQAVEQQPAV